MNLPKLVAESRLGAVELPAGFEATSPKAIGGAPTQQLAFTMQQQSATNWCWAAVAVSVALFRSAMPIWTQCQVASLELGIPNCCDTPTPAACDETWYLDRALARVGRFSSWAAGSLDAAPVRAELAAGRPIGCRIGWFAGGGHFVAISGIKSHGAAEDATVDDPFYGRSMVDLVAFQSSYRSAGSWTHTYYVT